MVDSSDRIRRIQYFILLVTILASIYMLTYSGRIISGDTQFLFDAVGSFVEHGDFALDLSAGDRPPRSFDPSNTNPYALESVGSEPLQILLATPLFWLAKKMPGIGLVHAVWVFNIVVSALAGGVVFLYTLSLGYRERTAIATTLMFGLGTIVWPYSKSFFREPLALLTVLLAAFLIHQWREGGYTSRWRPVVIIITIVAALLAKTTNAFALPALMILALPRTGRFFNQRQLLLFAGLVVTTIIVFVLLLSLLSDTLLFAARFNDRIASAIEQIRQPSAFVTTALASYLLSPGGSIWGTSPIVMLSIPGIYLSTKRRQYRYPVAVALMLLTFAIGYALLRGSHWFGGLSWPPRFLVPVAPFLILGALPAIDRVVHRPRSRWGIIAAVLFIYSFWVQLSGVTLVWDQYVQLLPPESGHLIEWSGGLYNPQYWRWILIPAQWGTPNAIDFVWLRTDTIIWPVVFVALIFVTTLLMRRMDHRRIVRLSIVAPVLFVVFAFIGLRAIYQDELYTGEKQPLHDILPVIDEMTQPGDVLLIDHVYVPFFLNYGKHNDIRVIGLPFQPGERPSPEQAPMVVSDNPDDLVAKRTQPLIHQLADAHERLWLLMGSGPFIPWAVRPEERFMATHYYPLREFVADPTVRLIEYNTIDAPSTSMMRDAEWVTSLRFGASIRLLGYTLPAGTQYMPGDIVAISLQWMAEAPLERDYTVAWFVRTQEGLPVEQGMDSQPVAGFAPTTTWQPGIPVWDNHALRLPETLEPGRYIVWLLLYYTEPDGTLIRLPVTGGDVAEDGTVAVLPTTLRVAEAP